MFKDRIGVIGAGKVGCAIAVAMKNKGFNISGIYTKSNGSFDFINEILKTNFRNSLEDVIENCDVVFITVSDSDIECVARQIVTISEKCSIKDKVFFHMSGALDSDELNLLRWQGAYTASLHPIQTFADKRNSWKSLEKIYYGFEGTKVAYVKAKELVRIFNGEIIVIQKQYKKLYHVAACFISNYVVTLSHVAWTLFEKSGIEPEKALKAFSPLIEKTLKNISEYGPIDALTGPISRGDTDVLAEHLNAINKNAPDYADLYKAIGKVTTDMALQKKNIDRYVYESIQKMFGGNDISGNMEI